jgi:hypothetical protein
VRREIADGRFMVKGMVLHSGSQMQICWRLPTLYIGTAPFSGPEPSNKQEE